MKICVITPNYTIAGVPLAQIRFARALANKGHEVDLAIGFIDPQYEFPQLSGLTLVDLKRRHVREMLLPLIKYLRLAKPDLVFSAEDHLNAVVLLAAIISGSQAKISCSSRVTPFDTYSNVTFSRRWILKQFMRAVMWRANALTCVSEDMVEQYRRVFKSPPHVCVYNIVDDKDSRAKSREPVEHDWLLRKTCPVLLAAGRLAPWKGFADLIRAILVLAPRRKVKLLILGDGPLRGDLEKLIADLGLCDSVALLGYVTNPLKFFAHANAFVLSSHVEGLPNVLVEAMMCGCTPVSTDCPTGPREVLADGKFGYLVPMRDPNALADGIEKALDFPVRRELLDAAVRRFEESAVLERHFQVLGVSGPEQVVAEKL
jgi:glycosyltransferase involved in cell wall biosynthesis